MPNQHSRRVSTPSLSLDVPYRQDDSEYDFVSTETADPQPASDEHKQHITGQSGNWASSFLATMTQLKATNIRNIVSSALPHWNRLTKRLKSRKEASHPGGSDSVSVDLTETNRNSQASGNDFQGKSEVRPLILINGSFMVGKTTVARKLAYILAKESQANTTRRSKHFMAPPAGPVEIHTSSRTVVLHMNEMYNARIDTVAKEKAKDKAGNSSIRHKYNKSDRNCTLRSATTSVNQELMRAVRTNAISDFVIPEEQETKTIIITDSLLFSEESADVLQQYRTAASITGRPFIHVYLTCSLEEHTSRLHQRAKGCVSHRPRFSWSKTDRARGKGKEREMMEDVSGCCSSELLDRLREGIEAIEADESRWLPVLVLDRRPRLGEASSSGQSRRDQFRGSLIDTTWLSSMETATMIFNYAENLWLEVL